MQQTTGITLVGGTTGAIGEILSLDGPELTREAIESTHYGTTTARTFEPGTLYDPGEITGTLQVDTSSLPDIAAVAETWTLTFPSGGTWAASGFMTAHQVTTSGIEDRAEASFTIRLSGAVTVT